MKTNDFAYMLQRAADNAARRVTDKIDYPEKTEPLQADKSATLEDFIEMVSMIVSKAMKKYKVEFIPDEGARLQKDQKETVEHPYILYEVLHRQPTLELKPRARQEVLENTSDTADRRGGIVWGQKFTALVQFNILACDYKTANMVMTYFEELIFKYTAYFKKNGVAELLFKEQLTDQNLDYYRQDLSVRSLRYELEVERLYAQYKTEMEIISTSN